MNLDWHRKHGRWERHRVTAIGWQSGLNVAQRDRYERPQEEVLLEQLREEGLVPDEVTHKWLVEDIEDLHKTGVHTPVHVLPSMQWLLRTTAVGK